MLADRSKHPLPVFGLSDPSLFLRCLKSPEYKLKILRKYAYRFFPMANGHDVILKINTSPSWYAQFPLTPQDSFDDKLPARTDRTIYENEELILSEHSRPQSKRRNSILNGILSKRQKKGGSNKPEGTLPGGCIPESSEGQSDKASLVPGVIVSEVADERVILSDNDRGEAIKKDIGIEYISAFPMEGVVAHHPKSHLHWSYRKVQNEACIRLGDGHHVHFEASDLIQPDSTTHRIAVLMPDGRNYGLRSESLGTDTSRDFFFGDSESGAMFVRPHLIAQFEDATTGPKWARKVNMKKEIDMVDIEEALCSNEIDMSKWVSDIREAPEKQHSLYYLSLTALASAWNLYTELGLATVDPAALGRRVMDSAWTKSLKLEFASVTRPDCHTFTRQHAFACIAEFETGGIDLASSEFESVMAISIGESIYVAAPLLIDPSETSQPDKVIRLDGNVGKSGLSLMVPPAEPMVSEPDPNSWRIIEREAYNGQLEDCFSRTSLHLSFTDWTVPVSTGAAGRGRRSAEAMLVETLVSVFDRGNWIGDLDVLTALRRGCSQPDHKFFYRHTCDHDPTGMHEEKPCSEDIVAIRSWEEFLDRPNKTAVVMAHGNWEARLAAVAMGVARGDRVFLRRAALCRVCLLELETYGGEDLLNRALFIA